MAADHETVVGASSFHQGEAFLTWLRANEWSRSRIDRAKRRESGWQHPWDAI
jgi:hypothetical protein